MSQFEERALAGEGTTLLTPTVIQDDYFGKRAVEIYRRAMCRDNDRPQRVKLLTEAIQLAPEFRESYFWRGILNFVDVQQNISDLQRALSLTALDTCQALVIQSQISAMSRNPEKAVVTLTHALSRAKNDGDLGEIYYFRAFANWWIDRDEDAFEDCRNAIRNNYNVKSCYTHLADMARYINKPSEEIEDNYRHSLLPSPRYTELVKYAIYLKKTNRREEALKVLEEAIQRNPYSPDAFEERASITYSEHDYTTALRLDTYAKLIQCRRMYAAVLADRQQKERALLVLSEGLSMKPRAEWYCLRGQLRIEFALSEKDLLKGVADLRKAVQINPGDPDFQFWLGKALTRISVATLLIPLEAPQRYRNTLQLVSNYQRISKKEAQLLKESKLPTFQFFEKEAEGLYLFSKTGTAYQYASTTRKVVCLLADFAHDQEHVMFKLFKRYSDQLYMWVKSGKPTVQASAERSLYHLWAQRVPSNVLQMMKKIPILGELSLKHVQQQSPPYFKKQTTNSSFHHIILSSECENLDLLAESFKNDNIGDDVLMVFVHYAYRKQISITRQLLDKVVDFSKKIKNKQFEDFLIKSQPKSKYTDFLSSQQQQQQQDTQKEEERRQEKEQKRKKKLVTLKFQKILKDLSHLVDNEEFSDIQFYFPKEDKVISVNKLVLSANCPYFSSMFNNGLKESKLSQIFVSNFSFGIWYQIMIYCYGGRVEFTSQNCVEILQVADQFGLPLLKMMCELYIGQMVDSENVDEIDEVATLFNAHRLKCHCQHTKKKKGIEKGTETLNEDQACEVIVEKN